MLNRSQRICVAENHPQPSGFLLKTVAATFRAMVFSGCAARRVMS
jgi:hypothetical protein